MKNIYIVSIVLLLVAVITVYVLKTYNKLILLRNESEKKHKEIDRKNRKNKKNKKID